MRWRCPLLLQFQALGVQTDIAARLAGVSVQYALLDIIEAATDERLNIREFSEVYFQLGERLELAWLRDAITSKMATNSLRG